MIRNASAQKPALQPLLRGNLNIPPPTMAVQGTYS